MVKNPPANAGDARSCRFNPWVQKIPWRRAWQLTAAFLPGKSQEQRSLAGYSPWVPKSLIKLSMHAYYALKLKVKEVPGGPVAKTLVPMQGAWARSLVRELDLTCRN